MKAIAVLASALACILNGYAAESSELKFGGERIGVPPLSLAESAKRAGNMTAPQLGIKHPSSSDQSESGPLSPNLLPRSPSLRQGPPPKPRPPQVSRSSGMPIIVPNSAVNYAITVVSPDPAVEFKMVVKDPTPAEKTNPDPVK